MTLLDLQEGEKGIIVKVKGRGAFRKRIMEMGFVTGKEVIVGKKAPLKNPVEYHILGYDVSLRNSEADLIEIVWASDAAKEKDKVFNGVIVDGTEKKSHHHEKKKNQHCTGWESKQR
jgi:ferrous iron transport protein B